MTPLNKANMIVVKDGSSGVIDSFEALAPSQAHRILGCYKAPTGQQKTAYNVIAKNALAKADLIRNSHLLPKHAHRHMWSVMLPSVTYSFPVNSISKPKLDNLTRKATCPYANKMGYAATSTHHSVIYGSVRFGGVGFQNLWILQGVEQACQFLKQWRSSSTAGSLSRTTLAWAQHNSGCPFPLLEYPEKAVPHLEAVWFASLRQFLTEVQCRIKVDTPYIYPKQREGDIHLMDLFQDRKKYSPAEMRSLNCCRLYMDVTVVSDICDASGRNLLAAAMDGDKDALPSQSRDLAAHQEHPRLSKIWSLWRGALSQLMEPVGKTLKTPLGKWLHHHSELKRQWTHFLWSRTEHQVYTHVLSGKMYEILDQGPGSLFHYSQPPQYLSNLPSNCIPVDIEPKDGHYTKHWTYDLYRGPQELVQNVPQLTTNLEDWQWDLLHQGTK
jgi:hypothetical protein